MSIQFLQSAAKARLKVELPALATMDSTTFDNRFDDALKFAIAELWDELLAALDPYVISTTISGAAPTTGAVVINTTIGDAFLSPLVTGAMKIFGDTILIFNGTTAKFFSIARITVDTLVIGGSGETVLGFFETKDGLVIYIKDTTMTTIPADLAYDYVRDPVMPGSDSDPIDVPQYAIGTIMSKLVSFFVQ